MRTDGEMFARRRRLPQSHERGPWHYVVTDHTEPNANEATACGIRFEVLEAWEFARYETIAAEFTDAENELEGVRPCCKRCLRVQNAERLADGTTW